MESQTNGYHPVLATAQVLIVEDNLINQVVIKQFLVRVGARIDVANNGQDALELLKTKQYDAVLMDIQMPVLDGLQACKQIREQAHLKSLPIIGLSAGVFADEIQQCFDYGMSDFISKPIDPNRLYQTVVNCILQLRPLREHLKSTNTDIADPQKLSDTVMQDLPGFNINKIALLMNDITLTFKLLNLFVVDCRDCSVGLQNEVAMNDFQAAQKRIHAFKGSACTIGADAVFAAAQFLDADLRLGQLPAENYHDFLEVLAETRIYLKQYLDKYESHHRKQSTQQSLQDRPLQDLVILLTEDNAIAQEALKEYLEIFGARIDVANNGQDALELLKTKQYDAVLMDIQMPVLDGLQACKQIREQAHLKSLPIIGLSARVCADTSQQCLDHGMNGCISKTVDPKELVNQITQWIR
ncbi:response regulator [Polynucleobacter sp. JS-Fieb-80-E5]|uniref:response regulator n=1 Tax=Polynucleobacter sp. JS-Fieb-80-E5 TaxID=2081050 RepID=UPI001C0BCBBF|nr:response regulator [Polynucleobacter sp. JS-Fieb-80-E5]